MEYLIKASVVIILFYLCFSLFLKKETFFQHNRWFLLIGLIIALVFPFIVIPVYIAIEPAVTSEVIHIQDIYTQAITSSPITTQPDNTIDWSQIFSIIYSIGIVVFLIQFILQFGSLALLLLKNPKYKDELFTYVIVKNKISPFSFFKWIVYNPEAFNKNELELILTHEKVHAKQLHSIDLLLTQLACVIFWFNPLIWLYRKEVRQNLEYIADNKTQASSVDEKTYQHLLLKTSVANHNISLSNNFYNSLIKERIVMLKKSRSNRKKQWRYLLILPLLTGLLMSMNTEEVYVEIPQTAPELTYQENDNTTKHIEVIFNKNMSDKELDDIKKELKSNGIIMNIKRIKRNNKGKISDINIDFETENGSANYNVKDDNGIKSFYFNIKDDGSFGVGAVNKNEVVIVGEINTDDNRKSSKSKSKTYIFNKEENKIYSVDSTDAKQMHEEHETNINAFKNKIYEYSKNDSIIVASVRRGDNPFITRDTMYFSAIDSARVERFTKLKSNSYYQSDKPVKIIGERATIHSPTNKSLYRIYHNSMSNNPKPLVIVEGKIVDNNLLGTINPDYIKSVTVLKGKDAKETYGNKGENGVLVIKMKDGKSWEVEESNPWRVEVSGMTFLDENDPSKNGTLVYITKFTSDNVLDKYKNDLEKFGLKVRFSKIKRNKSNEITSIKISIKNEKGNESSASYKDDDGISSIEVGELEGNLVVRTSTKN